VKTEVQQFDRDVRFCAESDEPQRGLWLAKVPLGPVCEKAAKLSFELKT
jgi:hypothetical protein